ncbi:MAG: RNA polymerase sigma-70 factor [Balneolales bacterium]|nr:RNA polymerase sigma-70 factor [Balneolales bacterium]
MQEQISSLAQRISKSDDRAFDELFKLLYNDLVRYSMKFVYDKDTSCNLVQDVFIKLWNMRESIDSDLSLKSYLYQMVRNRALNHIRDNQRETVGLELVDLQDYSDDGDLTDSTDSTSELSDKMNLWIEKLPDRQREAFELSRFEGLDHEEIAQVMNVSARTVNNHIVSALKHLRDYYDAYVTEKSKLVV